VRTLRRCDRAGTAALALYAAVAYAAFGLRLLIDPGPSYVGTGTDPQIFVWSFAWWPHAIAHGLNPFVTHALWAPAGVNLAWTTTAPGLALLFSPLTVIAGPVASYNVAAVLMPALAAWSAFLLCRHLTRRVWPSLAGGYLFGFSSYMLGQEQGHMQMSSVFLVPLVALVVLRFVEGKLEARALVVRLGPLLALQLLFGTEIAFTLTLALACGLLLGFAFAPTSRQRIGRSLAPLAASYGLAALLTAPFLYYLVTGFQTDAIRPPQEFITDVLNLGVPTRLSLAGRGWAGSIARNFPGNDEEQGAYLGVPTLLIAGMFVWTQRRTARGRVLTASLAVAVLAALGSRLTIDGHRSISLPWEHVGYLPLFDNVLVERLSLYISLATALMVALWAAGRSRGSLRLVLPALAVLAIVPDPSAGTWSTAYSVPPLFTDRSFRGCIAAGENILPLPVNFNGNSDLWQVASGFRFTMAGGYILANPPERFIRRQPISSVATGSAIPPNQVQSLRDYIRDEHVTTVVVDKSQIRFWAGALDRIAPPHDIGGVVLYRVGRGATEPPACARSMHS
jgi:hypothetical protein